MAVIANLQQNMLYERTVPTEFPSDFSARLSRDTACELELTSDISLWWYATCIIRDRECWDVTRQNQLSRAPACSIVTDPLIEDRSINRIFDSSTWRRIEAQRQWHAAEPLNVLSSQLTHANSLIFARGLTHNYYDEIWQFIRRPMTQWLVDLVQLEWSWVSGHTCLCYRPSEWVDLSAMYHATTESLKLVYNIAYRTKMLQNNTPPFYSARNAQMTYPLL